MSWNVSLSGGKQQVQDELRHAVIEINHALDALQSASGPLVNVSASGSAYSSPVDSNGNSKNGTGASFNVSSYAPDPPTQQAPVEVLLTDDGPVTANQ